MASSTGSAGFNFENHALPEAVLTSLNQLRLDHDLIDVVLVAGDKEIPCHRVVLATSSPYFKAMFTRSVEERRQRKVTLKDVSPVMLQTIIDYVYTSQVRITTENVQELLSTANFFLMKCLVYACSEFLIGQLDVDNCVEMHGFAESQGCDHLGGAACGFAVREFAEVCKTETFLEASPQLLSQYAAHEGLNVRSEAELLRALLEWLTHGELGPGQELKRQAFLSVVRHVRLPFVGRECLEKLSKLPSVMGLTGCEELFALASDCREDRVTSPPEEWRHPRKSSNYAEMLVVIGGVCNNHNRVPTRNESNLATYCCELPLDTHKWHKLAPLPYTLRHVAVYEVVRFKNDVYLTGGFEVEMHPGATTSVWVYRTDLDKWEKRTGLNIARYRHCSAVLAGHIFVIGGLDGQHRLASVEMYESTSDDWTCIQPMVTPVDLATATAFNGRLFVIGGMTEGNLVFNGIQCYSLESQSWRVISTLQIKHKGCRSVLLNDLIYVFGGVTTEVQVYDPESDKAFNVSPMISAHMRTSATVLKGKIYVAGGDILQNAGNNRWDSVECYDPVADEWTLAGTMPLSLYLHGLVTVVRTCPNLRSPPNEMLQPIGPSMLYRGYGEGRVDFDPR